MTLRTATAALVGPDDVYAIRLIDRRSGLPLRTNGAPLTIFTKTPDETAAEVLEGRDPALWDVRVERLATARATRA